MKKFILILLFTLFFCGMANAGIYTKSTVVDANGTWTDPVPVCNGCRVNIRIHPETSPVMTIYVQCRYRGEIAWYDVDYWDLTASSPDIIYTTNQPEPEPTQYRIGCKTGGYTSGNATVRVGSGYLP